MANTREVDGLVQHRFLARETALEGTDRVHIETISRFLTERTTARLETAELYRRILRGEEEWESTSAPVVALKLSGLVKTDRNGRLMVRNRIYRHHFSAEWARARLSLGERQTAVDPRVRGPGIADHLQKDLPSNVPIRAAGGLFLSHARADEGFARRLRRALGDAGVRSWTGSRGARDGDARAPEVRQLIEEASAFAVIVSPAALRSRSLGEELSYALEVQRRRGADPFPVIPIALKGTRLDALAPLIGEELALVPVSSGAGGVEAARAAILTALGKRDAPAAVLAKDAPLEELVLELTAPSFHEQDGALRASALARLVYLTATPRHREVQSELWRLVAPLEPLEAEELRWYLEKYATWPGEHARERARRVEDALERWGRLLRGVALPPAQTANVLSALARAGGSASRRFSVSVNAAAPGPRAAEAAALLLGLPWELLHDRDDYLFNTAGPVPVRRRLPGTRVRPVPVATPPVRVMVVSPRPEDDVSGYFDHRAAALPLVQVMEALGGLVRIHVLNPPTLPAFGQELDRARRDGEPYHVVYFDGHGGCDGGAGPGGLYFEDPADADRPDGRRHVTATPGELGSLLRRSEVPLVFLDVCRTDQAESAPDSVAVALLDAGVASVVTMSQRVPMETTRRFAESFYETIARGDRVGEAVLAGRRRLRDDPVRGRGLEGEELRLEDWFVPVLFQAGDDPQLFLPQKPGPAREEFAASLAARLGEMPPEPESGFVGRSRELLALQRLLQARRYAVVRGQGGEGKTALAAELSRWMVRSRQVDRAAFVPVKANDHGFAALDAIGRQLVGNYSSARFTDLGDALLPVEHALREQRTLLVLDGMDEALASPSIPTDAADDTRRALDDLLEVCAHLNGVGETRIVVTTRRPLPTPFEAAAHQVELRPLAMDDAVALVERVLTAGGGAGAAAHASREAVEELVVDVHGHALTLALLAPMLRGGGVDATRASLAAVMAEMERRFPASSERSLYAGIDLSLRRLSPANQAKARVLGVFHGGVDLDVLRVMMQWEAEEVASLASEMVGTGLATPNAYNHLTLHPALVSYLSGEMEPSEREALVARWGRAMREYVKFLGRELRSNAEMVAALTLLEQENLLALLDQVRREGDPEETIAVATSLAGLLRGVGGPRLLERVAQVRDAAEHMLGNAWSSARFNAQRTRVEQALAAGRLREAIDTGQALLGRAMEAGEQAYPGAAYDMAVACVLLGRGWRFAGHAEPALRLLEEARTRLGSIGPEHDRLAVEAMASVCRTERAECLRDLGRLDEAAAAFEEAIRLDAERGAGRDVAVGTGQLGHVRMLQRRYPEALRALEEARELFERVGDTLSTAVVWHQTGMVYQEAGQPEAAEDAYRQSLASRVRLGDVVGQARSLSQLGTLYAESLGRPEEALAFLRQALERYLEVGDSFSEALARSNLGVVLREVGRLDEARRELSQAVEIQARFGHAGEPWTTWSTLANVETSAGNDTAAAEARQQAVESFLAYLRDGGENQGPEGRIGLAVRQALLAGNMAAATSLLQGVESTAELSEAFGAFVRGLRSVVAGSRDRAVARVPQLGYRMAAEILYLIEVLEAVEAASPAVRST